MARTERERVGAGSYRRARLSDTAVGSGVTVAVAYLKREDDGAGLVFCLHRKGDSRFSG